jgi:hypothetical protein
MALHNVIHGRTLLAQVGHQFPGNRLGRRCRDGREARRCKPLLARTPSCPPSSVSAGLLSQLRRKVLRNEVRRTFTSATADR